MIKRVPEPEYMDTTDEAESYDAMDHAQVNEAFAARLVELAPRGGRILDLGSGTARIPIRVAQLYGERGADCHITAVDAAESMLAVGRRNVATARLEGRITLALADAKRIQYADTSFDVVASNSVVHHLSDPRAFLREIARVLKPSGALLLRDLFRPDSEAALEAKVVEVCKGETPTATQLFRASLWASYTVDEMTAMAGECGLLGRVHASSDRHWTLERQAK
jgi:ubiquinone/menaquinone biosynthesis C-methylase UbiE